MVRTLVRVGGRLAAALVAGAAGACGGPELGECDPEAAEQLVYGQNGMVATKGQALLHDSCGNAAFCHSAGAVGDNRFGAPAGMDFDMLPAPKGWLNVSDQREAIWSAVESGGMPPQKAGDKTIGEGGWVFDPEHGEDASALPSLKSDEGKGVLRNWLACGAPVVADTAVPAWARPPAPDGGAVATDWSSIYGQVFRPQCATAGCHNAKAAAGGLAMADECGAYRQLLEPGGCGPRLQPGDGSSVLLDKLESSQPSCGDLPMPPSGPLPADVLDTIRAWVLAGAPAENCD